MKGLIQISNKAIHFDWAIHGKRSVMETHPYRGYNARMRKNLIIGLSLLIGAGLLLSACVQQTPEGMQTPTSTNEGTLRPYPSDTPSATPYPTDYHSPTPSPTTTPTPTPVYYTVKAGDDMYSIAFRYGLEPAVVMTANPTVNPGMMSVGTSLLIPITPMPELTPTLWVTNSPTPTPRFAGLNPPDCYPDAVGGLWCFTLVENNESGALENLTGTFVLNSEDGSREEIGMLPLNLLPSGAALPLTAYFQPPLLAQYTANVTVDFVLPVMPDDDRYLDAEISEQFIEISEDGRVADVSGVVSLPIDGGDAEYVWVNVTAMDAEGRVVAVRRWEADGQVASGESNVFLLTLYSLGDSIDRIDVLVEAQRLDAPSDEP